MSPTLKRSLDEKVGSETLSTFRKQLLSDVNDMIAKVMATKAQRTKSPQSISRTGSVSKS